jgi:hypothetical protein
MGSTLPRVEPVETVGFIHKPEYGEYLKSIAYRGNGNRLEAYP